MRLHGRVHCGSLLRHTAVYSDVSVLGGPKPWNPWKHPNDPIAGLILNIKLRDTLLLEIGLAIAVPTVLLAIKYLIIKYLPPIPMR
jgi:hypothetical protein